MDLLLHSHVVVLLLGKQRLLALLYGVEGGGAGEYFELLLLHQSSLPWVLLQGCQVFDVFVLNVEPYDLLGQTISLENECIIEPDSVQIIAGIHTSQQVHDLDLIEPSLLALLPQCFLHALPLDTLDPLLILLDLYLGYILVSWTPEDHELAPLEERTR